MATIAPQSASATDAGAGLTTYGLLNFGVMQTDNGGDRETYFAENPSVPSRVGFAWQFPLDSDANLTFQFETGFGFTTLGEVSPSDDRLDIDIDRTVLRKFEAIYTSKRFGRFSLGQGSMASDGASGTDLSQTGGAIGPAVADLGGGTEFLSPDNSGTEIFVRDVFDDLDGPRRFRARYDTPPWKGLSVSAAYGQEILTSGNDFDYRDIALNYATSSNNFVFEAASSYEWIGNAEERALASASVLHSESGLNVTLATGTNRLGEGRYVYAKLGIIQEIWRFGSTAIAVEYYEGSDFGFVGSESDAFGIGVAQSIVPLDLELVAALRHYGLSSTTGQFQDIDVVMIGARWNF